MHFNRYHRLFVICCLIIQVSMGQTITLNEIMFDPSGSEYYDEFIEIYNHGEQAISLAGYQVLINGVRDSLQSSQHEYLLPAKGYALILDRGYLIDGASQLYEDLIPAGTLRLTISSASFGSGGLANTAPNSIHLISPLNDTLSFAVTTPDQAAGYSDEKILPEGDNTLDNWGNSIKLLGTPGFRNSITPYDHDLAITDFSCSSTATAPDPQSYTFTITVRNIGRFDCYGADLQLGPDVNADSILHHNEIQSTTNLVISAGDSMILTPSLTGFSAGINTLIAKLDFNADEDLANNKKFYQLKVPYPAKCLALNEFMYYPQSFSGGEWIELFNRSADTINLKYWLLADESGSALITDKDYDLPPQKYVILANDSSFLNSWDVNGFFLDCAEPLPSLNNAGDSLIIKDLTGQEIDGLQYTPDWGYAEGVSLERRNPYLLSSSFTNWGLSQSEAGGTPGAANSIMALNQDLMIGADSLTTFPWQIVPPDTLFIKLVTQNIGLQPAFNFTLEIRHHNQADSAVSGNLLIRKTYQDTLLSYQSISDTLAVPVDWYGAGFMHYELVYQADLDLTNNAFTAPLNAGYPVKSLVITELMYNPQTGLPEWFEIHNRSEQIVDLRDWRFKDSQNTVYYITRDKVSVLPGEYTVIAENNDFSEHYPGFEGQLIIPAVYPIFNNTTDSTVILDPVERRIDSLGYQSSWGSVRGVSLERLSPKWPTNRATNWGLSTASAGATPGKINSLAVADYNLAVDSIYADPHQYPLIAGQDLDIRIRVRNAGVEPVDNYNLIISVHRPPMPDQPILFQNRDIIRSLSSGDTAVTRIKINTIQGGTWQINARVINLLDRNSTDDQLSQRLTVGYPSGSVVINELMYAPPSGEAEWFELHNTTSEPIDLSLWHFRDAQSIWQIIIDSSLYLPPKGYAIIASQPDFSQSFPDYTGPLFIPADFPILNNTSDSLFLRDGGLHTVDTIYFRSEWGGATGISVERRNPFQTALQSGNWGSCQNVNGATPGAPNSILKYDYDLALLTGSFQFETATTAQDITTPFSLEISNNGILPAPAFDIDIYNDHNRDSLTTMSELVWTVSEPAGLTPDSSITIQGQLPATQAGHNQFIAEISCAQDENPLNDRDYSNLAVSFPPGILTLNEFLAEPGSEQTEFIELLNLSDQTINLYHWKLADSYRTVRINKPFIITPHDFVILARDSSFFDHFLVGNATVIIPEKWPGLNNDADQIRVYDLTGAAIDTLAYTEKWSLSSGVSLEKFMPELPSDNPSSWLRCTDSRGATPGFFNSVSPFSQDIALDSILLQIVQGDTTTRFPLTIFYENRGKEDCPPAKIKILDTYLRNTRQLKTLATGSIGSGAIQQLVAEIGPFAKGVHQLTAVFEWTADQNPHNDTLQFEITIAFDKNDLIITEFMPIPFNVFTGNNSTAEYIELYNPSNKILDFSRWRLTDENTGRPLVIPDNYLIAPQSYFVIAADSSIFYYPALNYDNTLIAAQMPSLNNDQDAIILKGPLKHSIDSLWYYPTWEFSLGVSKEKVYLQNPNHHNNWRSCVAADGGTPGQPNSIVIKKERIKPGITANPSPFTPNGDGVDDEIAFHYRLPFPSAKVTIEIYDLTGRLIARPAHRLSSASQGVVYWNGTSDYGGTARVGMYIARCTALDEGSAKRKGYITTFILARNM